MKINIYFHFIRINCFQVRYSKIFVTTIFFKIYLNSWCPSVKSKMIHGKNFRVKSSKKSNHLQASEAHHYLRYAFMSLLWHFLSPPPLVFFSISYNPVFCANILSFYVTRILYKLCPILVRFETTNWSDNTKINGFQPDTYWFRFIRCVFV